MNADRELQQKEAVQKESMRIQKLLEEQRKRQANKLDLLKYRNLQTRADNYFKVKLVRQNQAKQAKLNSQTMRSKSKDYHTAIRK